MPTCRRTSTGKMAESDDDSFDDHSSEAFSVSSDESNDVSGFLRTSDIFSRRQRHHLRFHAQDTREYRSHHHSSSDVGLADACAHSGFEGVTKRREANARERLRVKNLNSGFAKLRRILPTVPPNRKPSKVDTLQTAIDYIHQLEQLLAATGGIPDIGSSAPASSHSHSRQSVTECPFFPLPDLSHFPLVSATRLYPKNGRSIRKSAMTSPELGKLHFEMLPSSIKRFSDTSYPDDNLSRVTHANTLWRETTESEEDANQKLPTFSQLSTSVSAITNTRTNGRVYDMGEVPTEAPSDSVGLHAWLGGGSGSYGGDFLALPKLNGWDVNNRSLHCS